jgi:hypothetical protein
VQVESAMNTGNLQTYDTNTVLAEIRKNGFILMKEFVSGDILDRLESEAKWFLNNSRTWFDHESNESGTYALISPTHIPDDEQGKLGTISEFFSRAMFVDTCREYLHRDAYVDKIVVHKEAPRNQPVTEWHADQQKLGLQSFKFMLYFTDVTERNGAFSYVPGSHSIVKTVTNRAQTCGIPNMQAHNFEQIKSLAVQLKLDDCITSLRDISTHIRGDYDSDNFYSISAPRGSIIMFDTKGIHRGGVVAEGERLIMRLHCFEPQPISWTGKLKNLLLQRSHSWI